MRKKVELKGLSPGKLEEFFVGLSEKPFRARQLMQWIYKRGEFDFAKMTDLPLPLRDKLLSIAKISSIKLVETKVAKDGTKKFLFELDDKNRIESVLIPTINRKTLCISSQVGCPMACAFCATGLMGFKRNLTPAEIIDQLLQVTLNEPNIVRITNLVFMGMGEPLLNYGNVCDAIEIMRSDYSFGLGARKITLSTSGISAKIRKLANSSLRIKLAISLCSAKERVRKELMPKASSISETIDAAKYYTQKTGRWVTIEFILLGGISDSLDEAKRLVKLIKGEHIKVNLIPYNPVPGLELKPPSKRNIYRFQAFLLENYITATIRESKGQDILGACGQLAAGYK